MGLTTEQQKAVAVASARLRLKEKQQDPTEVETNGNPLSSMKGFKAAGDLLATVGSSGVAEIAGGVGSAISLVYGGFDNDKAVETKESISKTLTYKPRTEGAQKLLEKAAPYLEKLENSVDRFAERKAMGNPIAATIIKTTLLGGLELTPASKGTSNVAKLGSVVRQRNKEIRAIAESHGINIDLKNFGDDIAAAANRLTPEERAQNAPALVEALQEAKNRDLVAKQALYDKAKKTRTFVDTDALKGLSEQVFREIVEEGYDLSEMPKVSNILNELNKIDIQHPGIPGERGIRKVPAKAVNLNQLEILRKRTNKTGKFGTPDSAAGAIVRKRIDDFLDAEFNNAVIDGGRIRGGGAVSGDATGIQAWKDARIAAKGYIERYKADKTISQLIEQEATPEQYSAWLMGASAVNAKRQAALTVNRMKEVLGRDHPAIEGIRQDYLYEMYEPLLKEVPNFSQFTRNYDTMIRRNPSLVDALDLDRGAMRDMHDFARIQATLPPSGKIFTRGDIVTGVTRMAVGHQIAKAAVRVEFSRRLANAVTGVDAVTPKQIIADIMEIRFEDVAIPKASPLAAEFIAGAALTGLEETE